MAASVRPPTGTLGESLFPPTKLKRGIGVHAPAG